MCVYIYWRVMQLEHVLHVEQFVVQKSGSHTHPKAARPRQPERKRDHGNIARLCQGADWR